MILLIPWLAERDQAAVFPQGLGFKGPEEQEAHIRLWLQARTGFAPTFPIAFYPGALPQPRGRTRWAARGPWTRDMFEVP